MARDRQVAERVARLEEEYEDEQAALISNTHKMKAQCREDEKEIGKMKA